MAKSKNYTRKLSYISVPSQIINTLSSSSLQSLLVSPKKSSKNNGFKRFLSLNFYRSTRIWFFTLFLFGLCGMLRFGFNLDPLIPFSTYPCLTSQLQDSFMVKNTDSQLGFAAKTKSEENVEKDENLKGVNQSHPLITKGYAESGEESEFWKQPDGMGYKPCLIFTRNYRRQSEEVVKDRRKYVLVMVNGGMNQQRNQIVDAVVIARILGAALVVPILQVNIIWGDER